MVFRPDAFEYAVILVFHPGSCMCLSLCSLVCLVCPCVPMCVCVFFCGPCPIVCAHCLHACCLHSMEWGVCHRGKPSQPKNVERNRIPSNLQIRPCWHLSPRPFFFSSCSTAISNPAKGLKKRATSRQTPQSAQPKNFLYTFVTERNAVNFECQSYHEVLPL